MPEQDYQIQRNGELLEIRIPPRPERGEEQGGEPSVARVDLARLKGPKSDSEVATSALVSKPPTRIPGIGRIELAVEPEHPDARIFVIRNTHGSNNFYANLHETSCFLSGKSILSREERLEVERFTEFQVEAAARSTSETVTAARYLTSLTANRGVFLEGQFDSPLPNQVAEAPSSVKIDGRELSGEALWQALAQFKPSTMEQQQQFESLRQQAVLLENARFGLGARVLDSLPASIQPLPTESAELSEIIHQQRRDELILNCREDVAIEIINHLESSDDRVAVVVFGAAHEFSDNVERFNEKHNRKIALTVLEPESYAKDSEAMYSKFEAMMKRYRVQLPDEVKEVIRRKFGG